MNDIMPYRDTSPIWDSMRQFEEEMNKMFETPFFRMTTSNRLFPKVNIRELELSYLVDIAIPGFEKKDIELEFKNGCLHIKSKRQTESEEAQDNYIHREISSRAFYRAIPFVKKIDESKIKAVYSKGLMTVTLPKLEAKEEKSRKILIE